MLQYGQHGDNINVTIKNNNTFPVRNVRVQIQFFSTSSDEGVQHQLSWLVSDLMMPASEYTIEAIDGKILNFLLAMIWNQSINGFGWPRFLMRSRPNQPMKPTAPLRMIARVFATTPCRALSFLARPYANVIEILLRLRLADSTSPFIRQVSARKFRNPLITFSRVRR